MLCLAPCKHPVLHQPFISQRLHTSFYDFSRLIYLCVWSTCRGQEGLCLDSLELEQQAIMNYLVWALVTELRPSEIVVNALNYL